MAEIVRFRTEQQRNQDAAQADMLEYLDSVREKVLKNDVAGIAFAYSSMDGTVETMWAGRDRWKMSYAVSLLHLAYHERCLGKK